MIKRILIAIGIVLGVIAVFFFMVRDSGQIKFKTAKVTKGNLIPSVSATGRVSPTVSVSVGTQISGTIKKIYVDYNERVKRNQLLIELDQEIYRGRVIEAEANVASAKAQVEKVKAEMLNQDAEFNRIKELFEKGYISKNEYDSARYRFESNKAAFDSAIANLKNAEANLDISKENLSKTVIRSPMDGIVLTKDVEEGQTVAASLQAPTLLTVGDLSEMEIHTAVDEADIGNVKGGQKVIFYVDSYPNREFEGRVYKVYYSPKIEQNVVTYDTLIRVKNTEMLLRPGMTANVKIILDEKKDVLLIPNRALRVRFPDELPEKTQKGQSVWVIENGKHAKRMIKIGMSDAENTEVLEGLKEGDIVIIESPEKKEKKRIGGFH
ncbi:MAG: efflux RND transporter periplasmic adaptor subunit [Nitrospirota bacterium]